MEQIKPRFKKSAHALALMPSKQSLDLSDFDRKLINVILKSSIEAGAPDHELPRYKGRFFGMSQTEIGARMALPKMFDYAHLRNSLEKLQHITLKMESPSDADNEMEGAPSRKLLGSLVLLPTVVHEKRDERVLEDGNLMSWWQFNENLEHFLLDPVRYATLRIESITAMKRGPAIALYEICARFATSPSHSTGFKALDWWVQALTGHLVSGAKRSVTYSEYKYFSRDVLVPSVKEVNEKTELDVELKLKKVGRKVTEIRFVVKQKITAVEPAKSETMDVPTEALRIKALSLKMTDKFFSRLCKEHPLNLVQTAVDTLGRAITKREGNPNAEPIRSSNAYVKTVIDNILEERNSGQKSLVDVECDASEPLIAPRPVRREAAHDSNVENQHAQKLARFNELALEQREVLFEQAIIKMGEQANAKPTAAFLLAKPIRDLKNRKLTGMARAAVLAEFDQIQLEKS